MRHQTITTDVLIVGAGPAGLTVAGALARQGVDVLVVERHAGTSPFPKATGVSARTMEIFRSWGIDGEIRAGAMRVRPVMTMSRTIAEGPFATMPFGFPSDEEAMAVSPSTVCCCPQDHLEPVLLRHLLAQGGQLRFDTELISLTTDDRGATAETVDRTTGIATTVRARYVIGADGPRSAVRAAVGIEIDDLGSIGEFMAVTVRAPLSELFADSPGAINFVQIPDAEGLLVPTGAGDRWIYAREWHPGSGEDPSAWTDERCVALVRAAAGVPDLAVDVLSVMPFTMGGHVARRFRAGRAFLVGDAAHRTTPVGGTGMNTAIHAAHNLGWKLGWVIRGLAGEALLDSYEPERRPIGIENVARSLRRGEVAGNGLSWDLGVRYDSAVLAERSGGPAQPGDRAPHAAVLVDGRECSTHDLFEDTMTVLAGPAAGATARAAVAGFAADGMPVRVLAVGVDLVDPHGALAERFGLTGDGAVLVRPDGYIAWRGDGAGELAPMLTAAVRTALGGAPGTGGSALERVA